MADELDEAMRLLASWLAKRGHVPPRRIVVTLWDGEKVALPFPKDRVKPAPRPEAAE